MKSSQSNAGHLDPQLDELQQRNLHVWRQLLEGHQQAGDDAMEAADLGVPAPHGSYCRIYIQIDLVPVQMQ